MDWYHRRQRGRFPRYTKYVRAGVLARNWGASGLADNVNFGERGD
jgi:hypothetical protein